MGEFPGISADSMFLLAENRFQDSKPFYEEHKPAINARVVQPLRLLAADLAPAMLEVDSLLESRVSRVRRDTRFTKDKSLYRENMWVAFSRDKRAWNWCVPSFYADFSLAGAEWGLGYGSATPTVMKCLRHRMEQDISRAIAAVEQAKAAGFAMVGTPYARQRSTEETPACLRPLYDCKNIAFTRQEKPDFLGSSALPHELINGFRELVPVYRLFTEAMEEACGVRSV